jgi:hypothetical protein
MMSVGPGSADDAIGRLIAVAERLEHRFGSTVTVRRDSRLGLVEVTPRTGACPLYWLTGDDQLMVGAGTGGCQWELSMVPEDVDFVEALVAAAIAGRVSEVFGPARARLTVRLADGTVEQTTVATAPLGCLPVPKWTRRGRRVDYLPFS